MKLSTAAQMRECDRITIEDLGLPGIALMESASRGACQVFLQHCQAHKLSPGPLHIFCGSGNNGGDGLAMARILSGHGWQPHVILMAPQEAYQGDAAKNLSLLQRLIKHDLQGAPCALHTWGDALAKGQSLDSLRQSLPQAPILIDALLGTGLRKAVRKPLRKLIEHLNDTAYDLVFAVDIPSGLCADTGHPLGLCVRADLTATLALAKVGQLLDPGRGLCGALHVVDIGIPQGVPAKAGITTQALTLETCAPLMPTRARNSHKGSFGHVLAVGGSQGTAGALTLCAISALRAGAGLVTALGGKDARQALAARHPEIMSLSPDAKTKQIQPLANKAIMVLGPGLGTSNKDSDLLDKLLVQARHPVVLDADALNLLAQRQEIGIERLRALASRVPVILTPHPKEFARLAQISTAEVLRDVPAHCRALATQTQCVVLCKTAATTIAKPDGTLAINTSGNSGMATAGSGDVLAGILAGLLAQGLNTWDAARLGVFLHGLAGDLATQRHGPHFVSATLISETLGEASQACQREG